MAQRAEEQADLAAKWLTQESNPTSLTPVPAAFFSSPFCLYPDGNIDDHRETTGWVAVTSWGQDVPIRIPLGE